MHVLSFPCVTGRFALWSLYCTYLPFRVVSNVVKVESCDSCEEKPHSATGGKGLFLLQSS